MHRRNLLLHLVALALFAAASVAMGCKDDKSTPPVDPLAAPSASTEAATNKLTILTGSRSGNYYQAATELKSALGTTLELDVQESAGSFRNIADLGTGRSDLAIAQFDALKVFLTLGNRREKMAQSSLVVAPLPLEYVHVLVGPKAEIDDVRDLKGRRIAVGPVDSGSWISAWSVMYYMNDVNIEKTDGIFKEDYEMSLDRLTKGEIDAMFVTTALGMPLLAKLGTEAGTSVTLLSFGTDFQLPEGARSSYLIQTIPGGTYRFEPDVVHTLATPSYLLAHAKLDKSKVMAIARAIYDEGSALKKSELWKHATRERVKQDLDSKVPYHPGVREYLGL